MAQEAGWAASSWAAVQAELDHVQQAQDKAEDREHPHQDQFAQAPQADHQLALVQQPERLEQLEHQLAFVHQLAPAQQAEQLEHQLACQQPKQLQQLEHQPAEPND